MNLGINGRVFSVDQPGGAGQAGIGLVRALDQQDVSVTIYGNKKSGSRLNNVTIKDPFFYFNSQLYGLFWEQVILPKIIQRSSEDVLFCPTMNAPVRKIDPSVVVQIHDIFRYKGNVSKLDKIRQRVRLPRMLSHADAVVTVSEFSKSEILEQFDIHPSKVDVIYNGVDPIYFDDIESKPVDLPDEYILYVGGTNARKNIPTLLESFKILKNNYGISHKLVMVGPDQTLFHNYPVDEISGEDIQISGFISEDELKFVYENADLFAFPSLYEGFGMAPLEAMACGTPVVSSNRASLPEVLGSAAKLVDPTEATNFANTIFRVLTNESLQSDLIRRGKRQAQKFTWEKSAQRLIRVLQSVNSS